MPHYSSGILRILYSTNNEIKYALGDDHSLTVRGNRRLASRNSYKEHEKDATETESTKLNLAGNEPIPSGSGKKSGVKVFDSVLVQTDPTSRKFLPVPMSYLMENVGVITARPRMINLEEQKNLEEVTRIGGTNPSSSTQTTKPFATPDKWPLCSAIQEMTGRNKKTQFQISNSYQHGNWISIVSKKMFETVSG